MPSDTQILVRSTLQLYRECAVKASVGVKRNWPILLGSLGLYLTFDLLVRTVPYIFPGMAGGFVLGMAQATLLSIWYDWISETRRGARISFQNLLRFDYGLFVCVISVGFIFFVVNLLLSQLLRGIDATFFLAAVSMLMGILFNASAEIIHTHRYQGTHVLAHSMRFVRDNWIEWFVPFVVFLAPLLLLGSATVNFGQFIWGLVMTLAATDPLLPITIALRPWMVLGLVVLSKIPFGPFIHLFTFLLGLCGLVLGTWFMLFRAHLFLALDGSSRRSRIFRGR
jgi:hypothetical protein